jgi:CspA family cold shock protein
MNTVNTPTRYNGIVVWFDSRKGYGFIQRDNGQPDLFVHFSDITSQGFKTLKKDQRVSFGLGLNKKGQPKATDVQALQ